MQAYLLDTNVLSETVRSRPDPGVVQWLEGLAPQQLHVSVLTLGEIRKGALLASDPVRRRKLLRWLDTELSAWFEDRVLGIDEAVSAHWAELLARAGRPVPAIDSLLAATAARHGLVVSTRNVRDFEGLGVEVWSPWSAT